MLLVQLKSGCMDKACEYIIHICNKINMKEGIKMKSIKNEEFKSKVLKAIQTPYEAKFKRFIENCIMELAEYNPHSRYYKFNYKNIGIDEKDTELNFHSILLKIERSSNRVYFYGSPFDISLIVKKFEYYDKADLNDDDETKSEEIFSINFTTSTFNKYEVFRNLKGVVDIVYEELLVQLM